MIVPLFNITEILYHSELVFIWIKSAFVFILVTVLVILLRFHLYFLYFYSFNSIFIYFRTIVLN